LGYISSAFFGAWWNVVFAGFFANLGVQNVVFCVVNVVKLWCNVWLETTEKSWPKIGQLFGKFTNLFWVAESKDFSL
jgi:hypothetical protein